jgi:hypothetical protein
MFDTKNAYYAALYESQRGWHDGEHTIWPWTEYLASTLAAAYDDFEALVGARRHLSTLSKQERVREYVLHHAPATFRLRDIRAALPGVSDQTIRLALLGVRSEGLVVPADDEGGGRTSAWRRT